MHCRGDIMKVIPKILLVFILVTTTYGLQTSVQNNKFVVTLPNTSSVDNFQLVEWSTNLIDWQSVARNFGTTWQNTYPNTETLLNSGGIFSHEQDLNRPQVYYRLSANSMSALDNTNSIARFFQQTTFGPKSSEINQFPGINSSDINDAPYEYYASWIDSQIALPITSHRAFYRERSNPAFLPNASATNNGTSLFEVGYDPLKGPAFNYWTNGNVQQPDPNGTPNNLGQTYTFVNWQSGNTTTTVSQERYNDWLANVDANGSPNVWNPNDTIRGGSSIINQKRVIWYSIAIDAADQLRQRIAWALSQIFVIGEEGSKHPQATERWTMYYDIFVRNAFGNFRDVLDEVTYSPMMGYYLTYEKNAKQSGDKFPDENYAREVMQLFTIGLWQLNEDGTFKYDANGDLIPTYTNEDITEFAKVFTGLDRPDKFVYYNSNVYPNYEEYQNQNYQEDMKYVSWAHDFNSKVDLYGDTFTNPWGSDGYEDAIEKDIKYVLDQLFDHDNTPPFISRFLIQRFTASNPSPKYIYDVAQVFKSGIFSTGSYSFGEGERGDLEAVIAAILLHPEARTPALKFDGTFGKLREPLIKFISIARTFNIESLNTYGLYPFDNLYKKLNQAPYLYPSVFNFYRSDFQPNGPVLDKDLNAPEFQPMTDVTTVGLPNAIGWLVFEGIVRSTEDTGIGSKWYEQGVLNLTSQINLASDTDALINNLNGLITAGRLTESNRLIIKNHINSLPSGTSTQKKNRVEQAIWLMSLTPEFNSLY